MVSVTIEFDRQRELRFDFNAIADVEEKAGASIATICNSENMGFNTLRLLFWAGLRHEDKGLTITKVGNMLQDYLNNGGTWEELGETLSEAIDESGILGN